MERLPTGSWTPTTIVPKNMLFGHTAPILCLANGHFNPDNPLLVSSSEAGEMCLWDLSDGRCLESVKLQFVHTNIQTYQMTGQEETRLFCNGYYSEILVIDAQTLDILFSLTSHVNPDWIGAMHVIRPAKRQEDVVVGLSITGVVKIWTLTGNETRSSEPIYENESKPIRCLNPLKLTCCAFNQRTVLIVCAKYWQVYDAGDFSLLCSTDSRPGERWCGGDFMATDRVIVWSDAGVGYMYQLPTNCNPESKDFHAPASDASQAFHYCTLSIENDERLLCPPIINYYLLTRAQSNPFAIQRLFIRGDSLGRVAVWGVPDVSGQQLASIIQEPNSKPITINVDAIYSLKQAWQMMKPRPCGIVDQLYRGDAPFVKITSSVYLPLQGRLVCGREDGSIIMIAATHTVMLQLLLGKHQTYEEWPQHQILQGHSGRVNCLLYPHHLHTRYDISHLLSGGVDFSVCLWDIYAGTLLHRFSVHAGEITQLLVPPKDCNPRVLQCICSVGSDHSVALLSIKERKCVMLARRHLFPIIVIKWRPLDDFMIVGCLDGSVYVWQMETGHLDRVVQGIVADEILNACDENVTHAVGDRMTNPAMHLLRGLRHRNLSAIRQAAARGLHQLGAQQQQQSRDVVDMSIQSRSHPLMIQGLKANPKDQDSHVLFFDVESLIVNMLSDEYSLMSPGTLESHGLTQNNEYQKFLQMSCSPETQHKFSGFFNKVKENAENAAQKIQQSAGKVGFKPGSAEVSFGRKASSASLDSNGSPSCLTPTKKPSKVQFGETNLTMEIAHILLSLLHGWGLDSDLDHLCDFTLGLLKPLRPVNFGLLSKGGHMSLLLPPCITRLDPEYNKTDESSEAAAKQGKHVRVINSMPPECALEEPRARRFAAKIHWELSTAVTTNHLLSVIALANTLMSMSNATFKPEQERKRKLYRRLSRANSKGDADVADTKALEVEAMATQQQQVKQGWSLLAALHCVLLPEQLKNTSFKKPLVEILARRWQDRCLEIREAAQALLLAELQRRGTKGRKLLVDEWAPYLPQNGDQVGSLRQQPQHPTTQSHSHTASHASSASVTPSQSEAQLRQIDDDEHGHSDQDLDDIDDHGSDTTQHAGEGGSPSRRPSSTTAEGKRKQATAIILLGVIGAEYGHEMEQNKKKAGESVVISDRKKSFVDGFGPGNYSLARHTSHALAYLLLAKPTRALPLHTSLRRAAIDLIGRGFTVWEPYLDVSKILLGLLELCCESEKLVPSMSFGLPLTPAADSCRTAKHAISLIATARPAAFITTLAREVARYNSIQQNPNAINVNMFHTVLARAKPEILRNVELLIDKMQSEIADLIVETMDIVLHCLDINHLKTKGLHEVFPAVVKFGNVSYCGASRRIAVGAKNGALALYELRTPQKSQTIMGHAHPITCCSFSPDGKHLASYSMIENKLCFWSTATSLFGLGNAQTRCVRTYNTPPAPASADNRPSIQSAKFSTPARLVWVANRVVILMLSDGTEYRYTV